MRLDNHTPKRIVITLSKRNLLALLTKLEHPASYKGIFCAHEDGSTVWIFAEDDEGHYMNRPPPGRMIPWTEEDIAQHPRNTEEAEQPAPLAMQLGDALDERDRLAERFEDNLRLLQEARDENARLRAQLKAMG